MRHINICNGVLYHGDCIEVMRSLPAESVRLVVTSPPYNIRNSSGGGMHPGVSGKWPNAELQHGYNSEYDDSMPHEEYVKWQRKCLMEMMRLLKDDGAIFYNHKWRVQNGLMQDRSDIVDGFPVRQIIIWQRSGGINFNDGYFVPDYEVIYLIAKPKFKLLPKKNGYGCVWRIHQETNNPHPAPMPLKIASRCIESVSNGLILDPFMGSGTTAIAAEMARCEWIGIEKIESFVDMSEDRITKTMSSHAGTFVDLFEE